MKVYAAEILDTDAADMDKVWKLLDKERRKKAAELKIKKERERSITAGLLLRYAFLEYGYDVNMWQNIEIEKGEYGKPQIRGYEKFHYSLSHSGDWVICVTDSAPVGADIQQMRQWKMQLAKRFYDENEYNRLVELNNQDKDIQTKEFYSMWSAKESAVKLSGRGIGAGISRYVTNNDYSCIYDTDKNKDMGIKLYDGIKGYIVCVCSKTGVFPKKLEFINVTDISVLEQRQMEEKRC